MMLKVVCELSRKWIVLPITPFAELQQNTKLAPFFSKCRLAFDGMHIPAHVPAEKSKPFQNRSGYLSHNTFTACTFGLKFAFVSGWEGEMHWSIAYMIFFN